MTTDVNPVEDTRPLRADAARNRELILQTAAEVFAEHGLDAGYDEIARRAGVGVGTVYRRFPERAELVQALFESRISEIVVIADAAASYVDAFEGLTWFLAQALERQVADRGLKECMVRTVSEEQHRAIGRERLGPIVQQMVDRAQADGTLRADLSATDLGMQLMVMSVMTTPDQPELWRRYLALFVDAIRARPGLETLPLAAPAEEALHDLMCNMQGR